MPEDDDRIKAPKMGAAFTKRVWESEVPRPPQEREEKKEAHEELKHILRPPLAFDMGGSVSSTVRSTVEKSVPEQAENPSPPIDRSLSGSFQRARLRSLAERRFNRAAQPAPDVSKQFEGAQLKGLAQRRFERAAQDERDRGR